MKITSGAVNARLRLSLFVCLGALAVLLVPEVAAAHLARYEYKFPLPLWVFLSAGAAAVALSAPAAAFAVQQSRDRTSANLYRLIAPLRLGILGTVLATPPFSCSTRS
jgi:hypothetical protein